jgi:soluble lytic murein transglycosylase
MPHRRAVLAAAAALVAPAAPAQQAKPGTRRPAAPAGDADAAGRLALAHADAGRWAEAEATARDAAPIVAKYVTWRRLTARSGGATAWEIVRFGLENPDWPSPDTLAQRAEEALAYDADDGLAGQWFAAQPPRRLEGHRRLAEMQARGGRGAEATATLRRGWTAAPGDAAVEPGFLDSHAAALRPADHWQRFDRTALLRQGAPARLVPLLDDRGQRVATARLAYAADQPDADAPPNAAAARGDLGLTFERARWLRRRERDAEAAAAWTAGASQQRDLPPEVARAIWTERQILARKLLRLGDASAAYRTAAQHGQDAAGEPRQEAEFLAGFIALRRLNDAAAAERHFIALRDGSQSTITRGRSFFWQGRAAQAQGAAGRARDSFGQAAALPLGFYGQLGALALGEDAAALARRIRAVAAPAPTAAQQRAAADHELTLAVLALAALGEASRTRALLLRQEALAAEPGAKLLPARLALRIGRPDHAVWVVRRAAASGLTAPEEGWPTPFATPDDLLEPAIVNAITRQESNFDPSAVSSANARGLMQLLPTTARLVARQLGIRHQVGMLTADPAHNMRLGAAYLSGLLGRFDGALPLAAAGYNAGPGRVNEWVGTYGDPRFGALPMLDWMEQIPFAETRNYVQRVLENVAIYRARAGGAAAAQDHPMARWLRDGA